MPNAWYQRLYLVLGVVLGSIYLLVPTFFWHPSDTGSTVAVAASPVPIETRLVSASNLQQAITAIATTTSSGTIAEIPGWMSFFPKKRLHLGLDLVGGSHLGLGVDTEETLRAIASGHRRDVKDQLTKEGIAFIGSSTRRALSWR